MRADYNPSVSSCFTSAKCGVKSVTIPAEALGLSTPLYFTRCAQPLYSFVRFNSATLLGSYLPASLSAFQGKFGTELLANARHEGVGKEYACTNKELLFKHGEKAQPAAGSFCSLNELTMGKLC